MTSQQVEQGDDVRVPEVAEEPHFAESSARANFRVAEDRFDGLRVTQTTAT